MNFDEKTRELLGRTVRRVWIEWARQQVDPRPSWLAPWEELSPEMQEVDCRIGVALADVGRRMVRVERLDLKGGECTCDPNPASTEGPEVDCPEHGLSITTMIWLYTNGLCAVDNPTAALEELRRRRGYAIPAPVATPDVQAPAVTVPPRVITPGGNAEGMRAGWVDDAQDYLSGQGEVEEPPSEDLSEVCRVCGDKITTMAFKKLGACGELHLKELAKARWRDLERSLKELESED